MTPGKKTMASPATVDFSRLQAAPVTVSAKGAKNSQLTINGAAVYWAPGEPMECAFGPRAYDGSADVSRVSLCLRPTQAVLSQLDALDTAILNIAQQSSQAFFGKELTRDQISDRYVSPIKTSPPHPPLFRPKINLSGANPCRFWDDAGRRAELPEHWAGGSVTTRLCVKGLWFSQGQFGCLVEIHDAHVHLVAEQCPF